MVLGVRSGCEVLSSMTYRLYWFLMNKAYSLDLCDSRQYYLGRLPVELLYDVNVKKERVGLSQVPEDYVELMASEIYVYDPVNYVAYATGVYSGVSRPTSRLHTLLHIGNGFIEVVDHGVDGRGSSYGTIVNGQLLPRGGLVRVASGTVVVGERVFYIAFEYEGRWYTSIDPYRTVYATQEVLEEFRRTRILRSSRETSSRDVYLAELDPSEASRLGRLRLGDLTILFTGSGIYKTIVLYQLSKTLRDIEVMLFKGSRSSDIEHIVRGLVSTRDYVDVVSGNKEAKWLMEQLIHAVNLRMSREKIIELIDKIVDILDKLYPH